MERLIEYYLTDRRFNVFVVTPGDASPHALCLTFQYGDMARLVASFRRSIWRRQPVEKAAVALGAALLEPLRELGLIEDDDVLCIAPHRCLHGLPFAALGPATNPAVARNPLVHVPTAALLPSVLKTPSTNPGRPLVLVHNREADGDELRASFQREAESVASVLGADMIDATAGDSLAALSARLPGARAVHFVCHAHYGGAEGGRSGLLLCDETGRDRLVSIDDLSALHLAETELVSFGGCDTGRTEPHQSDDGRGIIRAALSAGAASVLATLWPIDSHVAELVFPAFFTSWQAGHSRAESLRRAQLRLLEPKVGANDGADATHPIHWAPYTLVGNWR